jgi:hypothetical protein
MNIILLTLIIIGLILHNYLSSFWEDGTLPYSHGFVAMASLFALLYFINFIRMFGVKIGLILGFLCFFQIIFNLFLWFILYRSLRIEMFLKIKVYKSLIGERSLNLIAFSLWGFLVPIILVLTIINFFYSNFEELKPFLTNLYNAENSLLYFLIFIIFSFTIRTILVNKWSKS